MRLFLTALCLILCLLPCKAGASEWQCFVAGPDKNAPSPSRFCYNPDTVTRDNRRNLITVWIKRIGPSEGQASQIEVGCFARMFRVIEAPKDFWDSLQQKTPKGGSTVGNWIEITPDSEVDAVRRAVCNPTPPANPSPGR